MTGEDVLQELERDAYVPLRLHLSSGQTLHPRYPNSAYVRRDTLLIPERLAPNTVAIGNYDVIALGRIERIEQVDSENDAKRTTGRKKKR